MSSETGGISRRRFLVVAGGAAAAATVGCGPGSVTPGPQVDAAAPPDLQPAGCKTPSTGPGQAYCLVESLEIRVAGAAKLGVGEVVLMNVDDNSAVIVARDDKGFYAMSGICTHSCCILTVCGNATCTTLRTNPGNCGTTPTTMLVRPGRAFLCPCHGSEFRADGTAATGPATNRLPPVPLRLDGSDAVVDLGRKALPDDRV